MRLIVIPILAGFLGSAGITLVMWAFNKSDWTNADMVRAVGGLFTRKYENALQVGLVMHFSAGIIISGLYLHVLSLLSFENLIAYLLIGGVIGFVHGFIFSFVMVIFAEHHPLPQFKEADFEVAIAHIAGHVVYGLIIGTVFWTLKANGFDVSPGL